MSWETSDGAAEGIKPERALRTILGGESPPRRDECMSMPELLAWILAVPEGEAATYDDAVAAALQLGSERTQGHLQLEVRGYLSAQWAAEREGDR